MKKIVIMLVSITLGNIFLWANSDISSFNMKTSEEEINESVKYIIDSTSSVKANNEITDIEKQYLINSFFYNVDVKNILSSIKVNPETINLKDITTYKINTSKNYIFYLLLVRLEDDNIIIFKPQYKLQDGSYSKSSARLVKISKDDYKDALISEEGKILQLNNNKTANSQERISCAACRTLPNGFHEGEVKTQINDTDWSCVRQKQGRCAVTCGVACAIGLSAPGCLSCIGACEAGAVYDCTTTKEGCAPCNDAPPPGDFMMQRIK